MSRYYLAYATANDGWRFFRDLQNFQRLAAFDPGVAHVDIFMAVSEAVARTESNYRELARLCQMAETNSRLRVRQLAFKPNEGGDFSSWSRCLAGIADECSPDDYVLCLNRSAFGPSGAGWYARFVDQLEREPGSAPCADSIDFEGHDRPPGRRRPHVHSYAFLGKAQFLAGHLDRLASPGRATFQDGARDQGPVRGNAPSGSTSSPFRRWRRRDYLATLNPRRRLAWLLELRRPGPAKDAWAEWSACLHELSSLQLEEEIPHSRLMSGSAEGGCSTPPAGAGDLSGFASRIGVHLHLHYHDLWPEFRASLAHLPPGFGLHVTTNDDNAALFESIAAEFPGVAVTIVPNRGRDIAPFLALLRAGAFDRYDYVCKLHTKKSLVKGEGADTGRRYFGCAWRRRAVADLLGTPGQVSRILSLFEADPAIGLIGCAALRQPNPRVSFKRALGRNRTNIEALLSRCAGRGVPPRVDYFAGSMYWFRPRALQAVRALAIGPGDFPEEPCEPDGTLAHALERVIPTTAALSGYRLADAPRSHDRRTAATPRTQAADSRNE